MGILMQIFLGSVILGACSLIHLMLLIGAIRVLRKMAGPAQPLRSTHQVLRLMVFAFAVVIFAHTVQVWIWAGAFRALDVLPNISDAIYFSLVTYTTVGYGDVTVGGGFRIFGAMAAVTGLLNFGLSTAFLVGLFDRTLPNRH